MKSISTTLLVTFAASAAFAKLPAPSEQELAQAADTKAKAAEAADKAKEALSRSQDGVAQRYVMRMKEKGVEVRPTPIATPPAPAPMSAAAPGAAKQ